MSSLNITLLIRPHGKLLKQQFSLRDLPGLPLLPAAHAAGADDHGDSAGRKDLLTTYPYGGVLFKSTSSLVVLKSGGFKEKPGGKHTIFKGAEKDTPLLFTFRIANSHHFKPYCTLFRPSISSAQPFHFHARSLLPRSQPQIGDLPVSAKGALHWHRPPF